MHLKILIILLMLLGFTILELVCWHSARLTYFIDRRNIWSDHIISKGKDSFIHLNERFGWNFNAQKNSGKQNEDTFNGNSNRWIVEFLIQRLNLSDGNSFRLSTSGPVKVNNKIHKNALNLLLCFHLFEDRITTFQQHSSYPFTPIGIWPSNNDSK